MSSSLNQYSFSEEEWKFYLKKKFTVPANRKSLTAEEWADFLKTTPTPVNRKSFTIEEWADFIKSQPNDEQYASVKQWLEIGTKHIFSVIDIIRPEQANLVCNYTSSANDVRRELFCCGVVVNWNESDKSLHRCAKHIS